MSWRQASASKKDDIAIDFRNVSRRFLLHHEQRISFQDWFIGLVRPRGAAEEFWALRDVNFSVRRGEAFGILGRNGAGKSTLLKLVTRILEPTSGQVVINGRTHAMLELGAGFHPELSGRDNIFLNGSIYGFSRKQMNQRFPSIVEFAELERFIDTPVKHYSSGMFMRLGFSIGVHMEPDILVIDEVLAVGDAGFQRKSYEALMKLKAAGTTILFVSHSSEQIRAFCDRAVLLQGGEMIDIGPASDVVDHYTRLLHEHEEHASIMRVRCLDAQGMPVNGIPSGADLIVEVLLRARPGASADDLNLALDLYDHQGTHLFGSTGSVPENALSPLEEDSRAVRAVFQGLPIAAGPLTVAVTLQREVAGEMHALDRRETGIEIVPAGDLGSRGLLHLNHGWEWERPVSEEPALSDTTRVGSKIGE